MKELFLRLCEDAPVAVVFAFVALNGILIMLIASLVGLLRRIFTAK